MPELLTPWAVVSGGVFAFFLAAMLHLGRHDWHWSLSLLAALGCALTWPIALALVLLCIVAFVGLATLYIPVGLVAAIRGKELIRVVKKESKALPREQPGGSQSRGHEGGTEGPC